MRKTRFSTGWPGVLLGLVLAAGVGTLAWADPPFGYIDFEGLSEGAVVDELTQGAGVSGKFNGSIGVYGHNPDLTGENAARIFDSSDPTGDDEDLGTPNEAYGGPGIGAGGTMGQFKNDEALYNILILDEDLSGEPDDADERGMYVDFTFSSLVKVNSVTIMDVEAEQGEDGTFVELCEPGEDPELDECDLVSIPPTGNNGVWTIHGLGAPGVELLRMNLNGSGAIGAVTFNAREPSVCWLTTGGFHNAGLTSGGKDFTFGGNVGPPASGSWEVNDHTTGDKFHTHDVHITTCEVIPNTGPEQPGGKKGFEINKANWAGTGRLNGVDGFPFFGWVIDSGEPSGKDGNDKDAFAIYVCSAELTLEECLAKETTDGDFVFVADGLLDGGNVQIHPPVGKP